MGKESKSFHIGDVISCTSGHLVSPRGMTGIYDVLEFMHGTPIWTHQIPRACRDARPFIAQQHPELAAVDASSVNPENWREWLDVQVRQFGEHVTLTPIPHAEELRRDPVEEAIEMVGKDRVITITTD